MKYNYIIVAIFCSLGILSSTRAQDSLKKKNIEITSSFKPVLRESSKIRLNASQLPTMVNSVQLQYDVPRNHFTPAYTIAGVTSVDLKKELTYPWPASHFIKIGAGNFHLPFIELGSSGNKDTSFRYHVYAKQFHSKGNIAFQKDAITDFNAGLSYKDRHSKEWNAALSMTDQRRLLYGFQPDTLKMTEDLLQQNFFGFESSVDFRNTNPTDFGITYHPSLRFGLFSGKQQMKAQETNMVMELPVDKSLGSLLSFHFSAKADITQYSKKTVPSLEIQNTLYSLNPVFLVKSPNVFLHAGILPTWDQKIFNMLPDVMGEFSTNDQRFTLQLGWLGYFNKGSFKNFAAENPFLAQPDSLKNTRVREVYGGLKGTLGNYFSYSSKVSFIKYRNAVLFANDTLDGKTFLPLYEPGMEMLKLHGTLNYSVGERFSADVSVTYQQVTSLLEQQKAWGLIPLELKGGMKWLVFKDLWLTSQLWVWDGPQYRTKKLDHLRNEGGVDLNAGVDFRISKNFNAWIQCNNIFNSNYQRWNQYQTYGFNFLGGFTYHFPGKGR